MTRRQQLLLYSLTLFLMIWGLDLINALKLNQPVGLREFFNVFYFSHLVYAGATLVLMHFICSRLFLTKKYWLFALSIIGVIAFFILLRYSIEEMLFPVMIGASNYPQKASFLFYSLDNIYFALIYIVIGFLLFLLDMQIGNQKKQALLIQQNKEAELQFLRSQVNPHFLFNTLNNIYSLVYEQSPKAPTAMLQLSDLMRYVLYEKKEQVPVTKEWTYIQNFITLQKLRFDYEFPVILSVEGDTDHHFIPPYLLIPFIENSFKHGDFRIDPLTISLRIIDHQLEFKTSNKIGTMNKDQAGGIGLDNVKRRLELLYPGKYELETKTENGIFTARLLILAV
ncbi:MAG: histidine kinase [Chitinophagaceae bacterium]|nr:MAG: histidine kinase [Chitinophagaceae bacterium]